MSELPRAIAARGFAFVPAAGRGDKGRIFFF